MSQLRRGVVLGAAYGFAVVTVELGLGIAVIIQRRMGPGPAALLEVGLLEILLGAVLGLLLAPLLRLRGGGVWHALGLLLAWMGLVWSVSLDSPLFTPLARIPPLAGFVLVLVARLVARRWRLAPLAVGVAAFAAAILTPGIFIRYTTPATMPDVALAPSRPDAPDVVLVVLDTVRAANVSAYGYQRPTTPTLEALAAEGALFLDATSPSTWSLPSHASLFTGRFPSAHGAHAEHQFLDAEAPTLAQALRRSGYDTRCFTANAWISDGLGLTRGFAWQDASWKEGGAGRSFTFVHRLLDRLGFGVDDKGGNTVVSRFEEWLEERPDGSRPVFVFLNFLEAHFPYHQLPEKFIAEFSDRSRSELRQLSLDLLAAQFGGTPPDREEAVGPARDMYDAGILYSDHLLDRVVEALRRRGSLDRTILVVLSDHGELLAEHGSFFGHGASVYEPMIRVPLLVRFPPAIPAGVRVSDPVSTVGVYGTILDLAEIEPPPTLQVGSLVPLIHGEPSGDPILSEMHARELPMELPEGVDPLLRPDRRYRAWRIGSRKLVETSTGESWLFDVVDDPAERRNLAPERPEEVRALLARVDGLRRTLGLPKIDATVERGAAPQLDAATRQRLKELGYVE
jgi:arylsulfatase A-like enzyme